jgi:hypothetical protein
VGPFGDERLAEAEARAEMMEQGYEELDHLTWELEGEPEMFPDINEVPGDREPLFDANRLDCQPEVSNEPEFTEDWDIGTYRR